MAGELTLRRRLRLSVSLTAKILLFRLMGFGRQSSSALMLPEYFEPQLSNMKYAAVQ